MPKRMTEHRITQEEYDALLATALPSNAPEALDHLGLLIDAAHAHHDASGAQHAITIAQSLPITTWTSAQRAMLHFFLANANDDLRQREAKTPEDRWNWTTPHFDGSLLQLRQATNEPGFTELPAGSAVQDPHEPRQQPQHDRDAKSRHKDIGTTRSQSCAPSRTATGSSR